MFNVYRSWPCSLMCPQHGIKHKAAVSNSKHWLSTVIAALCFILFCGHINKHGRQLCFWKWLCDASCAPWARHFTLIVSWFGGHVKPSVSCVDTYTKNQKFFRFQCNLAYLKELFKTLFE